MKHVFSSFSANVVRDPKNPRMVILECQLFNWNPSVIVTYLAGQAPDYCQSYSGSALPFPDAEVAFDQTPNHGSFHPETSKFAIRIAFPNSYYSHVGTRLIPPHVRISVKRHSEAKDMISEVIELGEIAPFRHLSYQSNPVPRINPTFYDRSHLRKPRSQEQILRASGYRLTTPNNFWGKAVPHT